MVILNKKQSSPFKASLWYTICSVIQKGISMILIPLYVRLMSTEEYGMYTLVQSWESIILIFTTLNLAAYTFHNCLIKYEDQKDRITSIFEGLIVSLTTIFLVFISFFSDYAQKKLGFSLKYIFAMILDAMFFVIMDLWYSKQKFDYQFKGVVFITILTSVMNLIVGIGAVSCSREKAFAAVLSKVIVQGIIATILFYNIWKKGKCFFDKDIWKYALCFAIPLIPHFLSTRILQQSDRVMIQKLCNISQAGIYGFAYKISETMLIFNSAILSSVIPWTYKKLKHKNYESIHLKIYLTLILVGLINLILILLAPEIIFILGTEEYQEAMYVIPPIACSTFLMYLFNLFVNITYFYEQNKLVVAASVVAAIMNIILNYIYIPQYGYVAAGYTTLISYLCLAFLHGVMYLYTLHKMNIHMKIYNMKQIIAITLAVIVIGNLCLLLYRKYMIRYLLVGVIIIAIFLNKKSIIEFVREK